MVPGPTGDCPTAVLVTRWRDGEEAAFTLLESRFAPAIHGRIRRHGLWHRLSKSMEVEDLAQRIWTRALSAMRHDFEDRGPESLLRFLTPFVEREVIDAQRRLTAGRHGAPERLATHVEGRAAPGRPEPETPTSAARVREFLSRARALLTDDEFAAWELAAVEGYTDAELASVLDRSAAGVRGLVLRARRKLQRAMAADAGNRRTEPGARANED